MDTLDERVAHVMEEKDYGVETFRKAKSIVKDLKEANRKLKDEGKLLYRNNKAMQELVDVLEEELQQLKEQVNFAEKHVYSYEAGGWISRGEPNKRKMKSKSFKKLTVQDINNQLDEIIRLIRVHKSKLK